MSKNKTPNIAIIGGLGSGKSTLSNILVEVLGYKKHSFAKEVKYIGTLIDPNTTVTEENKAAKRKFWQDIGQVLKKREAYLTPDDVNTINEWKKQSAINNPNQYNFNHYYRENKDLIHKSTFYYEKLFSNLDFMEDFNNGKVIVDDMRFLNEANLWHNEDSDTNNIIIKCCVSEEERIKRITLRDKTFNPEWLKNSSETQWSKIKYDYLIDNERPIDEVKRELINVIETL